MKKFLFALLVTAALGVQSVDALFRGRCGGRGGCATQYECGPIPCCERQELITVRKPAEMICGYVCPAGTDEVGAAEERACCR